MASQAVHNRQRSTRLWITGILAGVIIVVVAIIGVIAQNQPAPGAAPAPTTSAPATGQASDAPQLSQLARRDPEDTAARGSIDAPVVLIEYADFRCAYCSVFANEVLPTLMTEYVDAGLVRIEWRDAPVLGETSPDAAIAAHAAGAQGMFWEYAEALYATSPTGKTEWNRDALLGVAAAVPGLDVDAFTLALDDPAHAQRVVREAQESTAIGVSSTPTFIVGNTPVRGAQPLSAFRDVIDQELAAAGH
ncbi:protein-disulfide isomerase [Microterricola gilva]|uniref:Protein-disulfide isomerase n=1 Tax=Microterricola gilva TaxID=393267 RepID=A0A4Q8ALB0_9MICO|nr:thioredoxin domain-containing protein [Microterricola gilva]RZU64831.1 protein-disulfide isomerase [Microterricola gilva]